MPTRLFAPGAADVLYLVDLNGYIYRAYHALPPLTSPSGEPSHAVFGTVNMLERLVRQCQPTLFAVAREGRDRNFRYDLYADYKATRPPMPEDLSRQIERVLEVIEAFNVEILESGCVEADDVIATAVARARERGLRVVIVSADKDLMQLVSDDVVLWDTMRDRVFGPPEVSERFGVQVSQVRDVLALMGDTSDNVPGVPSVGPKTAAELLTTYGTLENLYANVDGISKKRLKETLIQYRDQAFLSQQLVTLKEDCELDIEWERLAFRGRDVARLRQLYAELGFHRLLGALGNEDSGGSPSQRPASAAGASKPSAPPAAPVTEIITVLTEDAFAGLLAELDRVGRFALRVETSSSASHQYFITGLSLATAPGRAYYVPVGHRRLGGPQQLPWERVKSELAKRLSDPALAKVVYDGKHVEVVLQQHGLSLEGVVFDSLIAGYLLDAESRNILADLAARETGLVLTRQDDLTKSARGKRITFDEVAIEDAARYSAPAADATLRLERQLSPKLADEQLLELFQTMELPLARVLARMEALGVLVDTQKLSSLATLMDSELGRLEAEAFRAAGKEFNLGSPRQLETILFDELGMKPIKRTKTSRSTDAETLEALADEHELPRLILEHRQIAKLKGTYVDALPALVNPTTGRVHTSWEQAVAATGRLSSTEPNLQNIPIRTELGRAIRGAFIAPPGHELVSADYSQIELRVLAHLSQDPVLLEAFRTGEDVHTRTAMEIFEVSADAVTSEMRRRAKAVNFGIIYGQGDSGLAKSLGIPRTEAGSFISAYYRRYGGVRRFMEETLDRARASENVRTLFGRTRALPDIRNGNRAKRLAAERIAMNTPIQGTAADLLKLAMLRLAEPVTPGARMVLTVHDELVFEVPHAEVPEARARIKDAMENVYALAVPLVVDVGSGPTWMEAH
jgi:DNA polymerase-1